MNEAARNLKMVASEISRTVSQRKSWKSYIFSTSLDISKINILPDVKRPICKIDPNSGEIIARFDSLIDAAKLDGMNPGNFCQAVKKGKIFNNHIWKYDGLDQN